MRSNDFSSGYYCGTVESHTKVGTPVDLTFLDMKESDLIKERSFYMRRDECSENESSRLNCTNATIKIPAR
jgi:hypothetical protein